MTTTLEPPTATTAPGRAGGAHHPPEDRSPLDVPAAPTTATVEEGGRRLRRAMTAIRLSFHWMGVRKTLTPGQREVAAGTFGAAGQYLSAGKKLIDTSHPSWRACTAVRGRAQKFWTGMTLPWPEPGVRLIRREDLQAFDAHMQLLRAELKEASDRLSADFEEIKEQARQRLGDLYVCSDYAPESCADLDMSWNVESVYPPYYLRELCPSLYREEQRRVSAQFEEAVRLAEAAFAEELSGLVEHLAERLSGAQDGREKVFRDSAVENLNEFFDRFNRLNVSSSVELEAVVADARALLAGTTPQQLRRSANLRKRVAGDLTRIEACLDGLLVDRPPRRVIRRA